VKQSESEPDEKPKPKKQQDSSAQTDPIMPEQKPQEFAEKLKQIREEEQKAYAAKVNDVHAEFEIRKQEIERNADSRIAKAKADCVNELAYKDEDMTDLLQKIDRL
jgi:hypothetical protein